MYYITITHMHVLLLLCLLPLKEKNWQNLHIKFTHKISRKKDEFRGLFCNILIIKESRNILTTNNF